MHAKHRFDVFSLTPFLFMQTYSFLPFYFFFSIIKKVCVCLLCAIFCSLKKKNRWRDVGHVKKKKKKCFYEMCVCVCVCVCVCGYD